MTLRYTALRVISDYGPNRYRLIGPAAPQEKSEPHARYGWPDKVILVLECDRLWRPVVTLSTSGLRPGQLLTDAIGITVEE